MARSAFTLVASVRESLRFPSAWLRFGVYAGYMGTFQKKLLFRFDVPKKNGTSEACLLVYRTPSGFFLVATTADGGDAEVFLTAEEFGRFQRQLSEVTP
jgi:hypothetical protein